MLRVTILSLVGLLALPAAYGSERKMMAKLNKYNLLAQCYGEEKMDQWVLAMHKAMEFCHEIQSPAQTLPGPLGGGANNQLQAIQALLRNPLVAALLQSKPAQNNFNAAFQPFLNRNKRAMSEGLLEVTAEDKEEFMEAFADFKEDFHTKIGNLSCVMMQLQMLDAAGNINKDHFSLSSLRREMADTPAGQDPAFIEKMANGFSDCHDISRSWPQVSLDRNPIFKKFGRHMIFFECAKKVQATSCAQYQIVTYMERFWGPMDELANNLELPLDKYDAAKVAIGVMYNAATPEMKFVDDFFWQKSKFQ